jgi:hypothetical protein
MKITLNRKNVKLNPSLLSVLGNLELLIKPLNGEIISTDADRSIQEHVDTYKKLERQKRLLPGQRWFDAIPWGSKHLPSWDSPYLDAVDFGVQLPGGKWMNGAVLAQYIDNACKMSAIHYGLGVGSNFCHLDIRPENAQWVYGY